MAKEPMDGPHELRLENRARLSVNGVREVESFDEESVVLHTTKAVSYTHLTPFRALRPCSSSVWTAITIM